MLKLREASSAIFGEKKTKDLRKLILWPDALQNLLMSSKMHSQPKLFYKPQNYQVFFSNRDGLKRELPTNQFKEKKY